MPSVIEPLGTGERVYREAVAGGAALRRGMTKRWRWRTIDAERAGAGGHAGALLDRVMAARGLAAGTSGEFLDPKLTHLHDPSLMHDVDRAAERILAAARAGEAVVVYGDYDADGITATAILVHVLRQVAPGCDVRTYVPHRLEEGYGLNAGAIGELAAAGARVIVSVDCGVTATGPAAAARAAGVDLIITDHHNLPGAGDVLPAAYAVVHPRVTRAEGGAAYPFGELSGAGVAYKLGWRIATMAAGSARVDEATRGVLIELLAFAALGTIADVVPLVGENRVIARFGLGRIKHSPIIGLRALVAASGLDGEKVDAWDAAFKLAPRLNACGRMAHAGAAVELFTTTDAGRAAAIARELTDQNTRRRLVEREIFEEAVARIERDGLASDDRRAIVLSDAAWHAGVVGIVCSRLVERFGRPAVLLCEDGAEASGSGRSVEGFNLHAGLQACGDLLARFGGHDMAAGLRLETARVPEFAERFVAYANERLAVEELVPSLCVDAVADIDELTVDGARRLEMLAPFGRGNPAVSLLLENVVLDSAATPVGKAGEHVAMLLRGAPGGREAGGGRVVRVIGWKWGARRAEFRAGARLDVVVRPCVSRWNGRESIEPELLDARLRVD